MPFREVVTPIAQSKTLMYVSGLAMLMGLYALLPILKEYSQFDDVGEIPSQIHAALSLVLGCLLVFRTNTAYNRWWEARTLWGALVNATRNFATKSVTLTGLTPSERDELKQLLQFFPVALRHHLRNEPKDFAVLGSLGQFAPGGHIPQAVVERTYEILSTAYQSKRIDGDVLRMLDLELLRFMDVCGGCERIAKTRIVGSYRTFARQCTWLFLLTLPWGISRDFGWWTIPLTVITSYFMIGLETVAEHVEEPFGYDEDDLDLEGMSENIASSVAEIFARKNDTA